MKYIASIMLFMILLSVAQDIAHQSSQNRLQSLQGNADVGEVWVSDNHL